MTARHQPPNAGPGTQHTAWCARDHRCNLHEHRSEPVVVRLAQHGRGVLTRVQGADGREHADVSVRIALGADQPTARWQLLTVLSGLRDLVTAAGRPVAGRRRRAAR